MANETTVFLPCISYPVTIPHCVIQQVYRASHERTMTELLPDCIIPRAVIIPQNLQHTFLINIPVQHIPIW